MVVPGRKETLVTTSVSSVSPRLVSAVSPDPAALLAAAAAELAGRWDSGDYDLGEADALAGIGCIRDALRLLAGLFDPASDQPFVNLYDMSAGLAGLRAVSAHAADRSVRAHAAMRRAVNELDRALDRFDRGTGLESGW